jgi:6-phosphogluconolactonase (cycloisomerase 2 family)
LLCLGFALGIGTAASATTPVVTVTLPANNSTVPSQVHYVATASSPQCAKGIAAMRIYSAPSVGVYTVNSNSLDTNVTLFPGTYNTVVQAWDNCGGVGKTPVTITVKVTGQPAKFLYSTDYVSGKVYGYVINPTTGALTPNGQNAPWAHWGPTRLASDKGGYRLYVVNQGSKDVNGYFINRTNGYLSSIPGSPFSIGQQPIAVAVHPSGKYVYVTAINNAVYALAVQSDGSLKLVAGSPFPTQLDPEALVVDPKGKYLYVSDSQPSKIDAYSIGATDGTLTPVPGSPFAEPGVGQCVGSIDMAVDGSGQFLVIPGCFGTAVYRIGAANGSIAEVPGSPFPTPANHGPETGISVAIDPLERFLYLETEICDSGCAVGTEIYGFNAQTGAVNFLQDAIGGCSVWVRADPSGKFVYTLGETSGCTGNQNPNTIEGLALDPSTGKLVSVPGSPFSSPNADFQYLVGLTITP